MHGGLASQALLESELEGTAHVFEPVCIPELGAGEPAPLERECRLGQAELFGEHDRPLGGRDRLRVVRRSARTTRPSARRPRRAPGRAVAPRGARLPRRAAPLIVARPRVRWTHDAEREKHASGSDGLVPLAIEGKRLLERLLRLLLRPTLLLNAPAPSARAATHAPDGRAERARARGQGAAPRGRRPARARARRPGRGSGSPAPRALRLVASRAGGAVELERASGSGRRARRPGPRPAPPAFRSIHAAGRPVTGSTGSARDLRVADVPDQHVPEAVLGSRPPSTTCGPGGRAPCATSSCSACSTSRGSRSPISASAPAQKTLPSTAASWSRLLRSGAERVQAGGDQRLHRVGDLLRRSPQLPRGRRAGARTPPRTAGCRRLARAAPAASPRAGPPARAATQMRRAVSSSVSGARLIRCAFLRLGAEVGCSLVAARAGRCRAAAAARPPSSRPGARGTRAARRRPSADPRRRAPSRAPCRQRLEEAAPGRERLLLRGGLAARTDERGQASLEPGAGRVALAGSARVELGRCLRGRVRLEDAALGLDDLPQRPEGDPVPVGKTAALAPADEPGALARRSANSSAHRRLLPTPGSPTIVTS